MACLIKRKQLILKKIDDCLSYNDKLEVLNRFYLKANSYNEEDMILLMIKDLKTWGY